MEIVLLKLTVTPFLMWIVSMASRRWGGLVGGLIAGMPLTSGPISVYLALEQGPRFADAAASGALVGTGAVMISYAAYAAAATFLGAIGACIASLASYGLAAYVLHLAESDRLSICVSLLAFLLIVRRSSSPDAAYPVRPSPGWDLPARMTASTMLVVLVTTFADRLGPGLSGLLSPVPVIAWPLLVFAHVQRGRSEAAATIRGTASGSCGIIVFYLVIARFLAENDILQVYGAAFGLSIAVSVACGALLRFPGRLTSRL